MLAIERRNSIFEYLSFNRTANVSSLAQMMDVTEETIRRDLSVMEKEGKLTRTHGGAVLSDNAVRTITNDVRVNANKESKQFIATECAKLVTQGDTLFFDSSTTAYYVAQELRAMRLTVITNSLGIANLLKEYPNIHLIGIGGDYDPDMNAFCSASTIETLNKYYVDKAFFSCRSIDLEAGLTDVVETTRDLRASIIQNSKYSLCVADKNKFNHCSCMRICGFESITALITDYVFDNAWRERLDSNGVWYLGRDGSPFSGRESHLGI